MQCQHVTLVRHKSTRLFIQLVNDYTNYLIFMFHVIMVIKLFVFMVPYPTHILGDVMSVRG